MTDDLMNGWDEIAAFLKCSVVTAWRYERNGGMPIIRLFNGKVRGSRTEIRAWIIKFRSHGQEMKEDERF